MAKIVIDAGHGGTDPGAIGQGGTREKDITLMVAKKVYTLLQNSGITAKLTRSTDEYIELNDRAKIANSFGADYFVSIHCNSATDHSAHGVETYCYKLGANGEKLATAIQKEMVAATGLTSRGVKAANFAVLRETKMPATLVEMAFISNPSEEKLLKDAVFQDKCAMAIAKGIGQIIGVSIAQPKPQTTAKPQPKEDNALYKVQLGAFANKDNAEKLAGELEKKGYKTYIVKEDK